MGATSGDSHGSTLHEAEDGGDDADDEEDTVKCEGCIRLQLRAIKSIHNHVITYMGVFVTRSYQIRSKLC